METVDMQMFETEKKVLEIERQMFETALKERFTSESDPIRIKQEMENGLVQLQDRLIQMKKISIFDQFELWIPERFLPMRDLFIERKYPGRDRPQIVYTNRSTQINITFSKKQCQISTSGFEVYLMDILNKLRKFYPSGKFFENGLIDNQDIQIGYFDFTTPSYDQNIYNFMFLFSAGQEMITGSINAPETLIDLWKPLAYGIMSTIERSEKNG